MAGWIILAAVAANLALHARIHEPLFHDANGYLRAARDFSSHGVLSHFELLWIRTYGYPLLLSWADRAATLLGLPLRLVVTEIQLLVYISAGCCCGMRCRLMRKAPPRPTPGCI